MTEHLMEVESFIHDESRNQTQNSETECSWNKMERNMKQFGFREGAAKGKDAAFQEGFDLGYSEGFRMGQAMGNIKGTISSAELFNIQTVTNYTEEEKSFFLNSSKGSCKLCLKDAPLKAALSEDVYELNLMDIINNQKCNNDSLIKSLEQLTLHKAL